MANGRVLVGVNESDTPLNAGAKTGGSTNPLTNHAHTSGYSNTVGTQGNVAAAGGYLGTGTFVNSNGDNTNHNNWQPFYTVYYWVRVS